MKMPAESDHTIHRLERTSSGCAVLWLGVLCDQAQTLLLRMVALHCRNAILDFIDRAVPCNEELAERVNLQHAQSVPCISE